MTIFLLSSLPSLFRRSGNRLEIGLL